MSAARSVLFVSNFLSGSGLNQVYADELANRLEATGWRTIRTSTRVRKVVRLADMVGTCWYHRHDYAVAHVDMFSGAAFLWAEAVCFSLARLGKPYVVTLRGGSLPEFARRWPSRVKRVLGAAHTVTVPSRYLGDAMRDFRADLLLLRNAVDARGYKFRLRAPAAPRLVWVRAFHEIYNPVLAVDVLNMLRERYPEATLRMIGPDKRDGSIDAVRARVRELGLGDRVSLLGRVEKREIATQLSEADIFLNTTSVDNVPVSVLEAMAAGLCVVSTEVGGLPYLLTDGDNALLVPAADPYAMTAAVERILDEPDMAERLSRRAHDLAVAHDWIPILEDWNRVLCDAASHG